ncbi:hypothetical protein Tsubulata_023606 [Turnera subulata]|uniref:Beta-glucosidase n=1 Tax=Turnera subulata TaxID=218843 RepID=A0A9Q0GEG2_9ROSI|nr:hypothetical protein Tsubulata_023606 [Turnera subulata]
MAFRKSLVPGLLLLASLLALTNPTTAAGFDPSQFPEKFFWGSATSAYQVEGAANKSGRGPSVWDTFTHQESERIKDGKNGDVAVNFYKLYEDDLKAMNETGLNAFRFSISWSRIIPHGKISSGVNEEGIRFYNNLINKALQYGLTPFVTLFHWDTPQALEDKYGGFLSPNIVPDFRDYANLCFEKFGDRVRHWITLNEPWAYSWFGYDTGEFAPGRCSEWKRRACQDGNSATEPYIVTHNLLLSHAAAVKLYRDKYQATQKGKIGITIVTWWMEPWSSDIADVEAAQRALDFSYGWYMDPITYGRYPRSMRRIVADRLPQFTEEQTKLLKRSYDFLGLNYYSSRYVKNDDKRPLRPSYTNDSQALELFENSKGESIGPKAGLDWLRVAPFGIRYLLNYTKDTYMDPQIYITENGMAHKDNPKDPDTTSTTEIINDQDRIKYYDAHLQNVAEAINNYKVNVSGFFAWSFMDNFEWSSGYTQRFGITYVNYTAADLNRTAKASREWFKSKLVPQKTENDQVITNEPKWSRPFGLQNLPI